MNDFEEYFKAGEPGRRERAEAWATAIGITRSTIQKHLANLKASGRLRRIGPDKGGHWEVVG